MSRLIPAGSAHGDRASGHAWSVQAMDRAPLIWSWWMPALLIGFVVGATPALADKGSKTILILKVGPDPTDVYIDGKKKGTSDKVHDMQLPPGAHIIRLVHAGDEHEDQVILKKGTKTTFEWTFEDDRPKPADPSTDDEAAPVDDKKPEAPEKAPSATP